MNTREYKQKFVGKYFIDVSRLYLNAIIINYILLYYITKFGMFLFFFLFFYIKSASLHQTQLTERKKSDIYIYEILNSILSCRFFLLFLLLCLCVCYSFFSRFWVIEETCHCLCCSFRRFIQIAYCMVHSYRFLFT